VENDYFEELDLPTPYQIFKLDSSKSNHWFIQKVPGGLK